MKTLHYTLLSAFLLFSVGNAFSQLTFSAGNDTTLCSSNPITLTATVGQSSGLPGVTTNISLFDDQWSPILPIGFTFQFFGINYQHCLISSNGIISFDTANALGQTPPGGYCQWPIGAAIPSTSDPVNCLMCCWQDLYPPGGGVVSYGTYGVAPNRVFVMNYNSIPYYSCTNLTFCSGVCIFETTNYIESYIVNKQLCPNWNGGAAIHGVQNAAGTIAFWVPGRNYPTQWTAVNDAWRFSPTGANTYSVAAIPYLPPIAGAVGSFNWYEVNTPGTSLGSSSTIPVLPIATTTYVASYTSCGTTVTDTVVVYVNPLTATVTSNAPSCNSSLDGSIMVTPGGAVGPWTVSYIDSATGGIIATHPGVTVSDQQLNLGIGTYIISVMNSSGCIWLDTVYFFAITPPAVFTDAPVTICAGSPVQFTSQTVGNVVGYDWNFGDNATASTQNPSHSYAQGGTYIIQYVAFFVGGCSDTAYDTLFVWDNIVASFTYAPLNICNGDTVHFTDQSSQHPISWSWNLDDNAVAATQNTQHAYTANPKTNNLYNITLTVTDSLCGVSSSTLPINVFYNPQPYIGRDTNICPGEEVMIDAGYAGNAFVWSNGMTTETLLVPFDAIGQYSVIVNNNGCYGYDTIVIGMECDLFMVNAFTPNGDGLNDIFHPAGDKVSSFKMWVYNRWGEQVDYLESNNIMDGWDGKHNGIESEMGTYVYQIEAKFRNGGSTTQKGNVTLIR